MARIRRIDWVIGLVLLAILAALVGLGIANHSSASSPAKASRSTPTSPPGGTGPATTPTSTTTSAPPATTSSTVTVPPTTVAPLPVAGSVSTVGDSIMLDIQADLQTDIPGVRVDGLVSRQFETGIGIVQADRAAGTLGSVLVVELGTNGTVTDADFDAMMQAASGVKRVVFVNVDVPRPWEAPDNAVLAAGVARYPGVAVLADWYALSSGHPEWFTPDQVHLQPAGAQALASLITKYA